MNQRRSFIKKGSFLLAGSTLLPFACQSSKPGEETAGVVQAAGSKKNIGVQVYSVRNELKQDFEGTLKQLAQIGFNQIEAYGMNTKGKIYGRKPAEYKKIANDLGLDMVSCHCGYFTSGDAERVRDTAMEAGVKLCIIPYLGNDLREDYRAVAQNLNKVGEVFKGSGIRLGYHNHDFEFETQNGEIPMEILIENTDPDLVTIQLDIYWITKAGFDPMAFIQKYPGRFSSFHIKDANEQLEQTTVGTGTIDFGTILKAQSTSGWEFYFVEDEREDNPMDNLKGAFQYLNSASFG